MDELLHGLLRGAGVCHGGLATGEKRMKAENVAPKRISLTALERYYLCMGRHSPCRRCEVLCHYGRVYLEKLGKEHRKRG